MCMCLWGVICHLIPSIFFPMSYPLRVSHPPGAQQCCGWRGDDSGSCLVVPHLSLTLLEGGRCSSLSWQGACYVTMHSFIWGLTSLMWRTPFTRIEQPRPMGPLRRVCLQLFSVWGALCSAWRPSMGQQVLCSTGYTLCSIILGQRNTRASPVPSEKCKTQIGVSPCL